MSGYRGTPKRVLIIDDQASQRAILSAILAPLGFAIAHAGSGAAGLAAIAENPPDLVLLDISMPTMDGWVVCRTIRAQGHADLPVIVVSATAVDSGPERAEAALHTDFVVKPVSFNELLHKIRLHLKL